MEPLPKEIEPNFLEALEQALNIVPGPSGSVMKGGAMQSANFSLGLAGWRINANGDVEFNNGTFRGAISGSTIDIGGADSTSFHVDAAGRMWSGAATFATGRFVVGSITGGDGSVHISDVAGTFRQIAGETFGASRVGRFNIILADSTAESGSNAGSNFLMSTHADNGTLIAIPMFIERKTGNIVIGNSTLPHASSLMEYISTTKGVRFPNMTLAQRDAITPGEGTVIFNTTDEALSLYANAAWRNLAVDKMDGTPDTDHTANGNQTNTFAAGYTSAVGDLVFFGSGGKWLEVDADAVATCKGLMGIALEDKTDTQAMLVALPGSFVRDDSWNWTVGATLYAGETLGAMQETIPTGVDAIIKVVGFAVSADVIYFNPSPDQQSVLA